MEYHFLEEGRWTQIWKLYELQKTLHFYGIKKDRERGGGAYDSFT